MYESYALFLFISFRAKHRRKLLPVMETLKFPEMSKGLPVPVSMIEFMCI